jgi:hypothetical protein
MTPPGKPTPTVTESRRMIAMTEATARAVGQFDAGALPHCGRNLVSRHLERVDSAAHDDTQSSPQESG